MICASGGRLDAGTVSDSVRFSLDTGRKQVMSTSDAAKPGDEAPPGAPGTGENLCRACSGTGKVDDVPCPDCKGTGKVTTGIGGG
jgi:hypothetical protein